MEKVSKKDYEAPTMKVVEFRVENGFVGSPANVTLHVGPRAGAAQHFNVVDMTSGTDYFGGQDWVRDINQ